MEETAEQIHETPIKAPFHCKCSGPTNIVSNSSTRKQDINISIKQLGLQFRGGTDPLALALAWGQKVKSFVFIH